MNMMNKCAKFHKDSPSDKKVKFNLPSVIELSETSRFCVQLCIETLCKRATSVAHLTNLSFEFFTKFSQKMPLYFFYRLLYHGAKKSKMTKNSNQGGGGGSWLWKEERKKELGQMPPLLSRHLIVNVNVAQSCLSGSTPQARFGRDWLRLTSTIRLP